MLLKQGLIGEHRYHGREGVLQFVREAGAIQFDPLDVCGRNADLVLQSRVEGFSKETLSALLYEERALADYPDKNLSIILTADLPFFERYRRASRENVLKYPAMQELIPLVRAYIEKNGPVSSADLQLTGKMEWHSAIHWSAASTASRSVLEQMYSSGDLVIHHKTGTRKFYDLAERHLPQALLTASDPLPDDYQHCKWRVLRRIRGVGLLWNRPSDAWLYIKGLTSPLRKEIFAELVSEGQIIAVSVEGMNTPLYLASADVPLLEGVLEKERGKPLMSRCELIAPLDNFIWDRRLIKALFGFDYMWEVYTPAEKRKYGYYVLPLLHGDEFVGRVEARADKKNALLRVLNIWYESPEKAQEIGEQVKQCILRFARFNNCENIA